MAHSAGFRKLVLLVVLCAASCMAQAQGAEAQARAGAVADGVSSAVGIVVGTPVNPVLPVLGFAFKAVTLRHAESLPETERPRAYALAAASWQGSAAGNACAVVSVVSGGSFLPACIVVGVAWGWSTWSATERERQEAERCAARRHSARKPKLRCAITRPRVARAAPVRTASPRRTASAGRAAAPVRTAPPARSYVAAQDLVMP